jgi:hypothetical protein
VRRGGDRCSVLEKGRLLVQAVVMSATAPIKQLLATPEPPELGPGPRANVRAPAELNAALDGLFRAMKLPLLNQQLVRALVLLWHDHLDASHTISQGIENPDGSLVHAIMHRREPDYSNSKYWWRRVGKHPGFPEIARRVADLLKSRGERDLAAKLVPRGEWDAFAFVDSCAAAADLPASDEHVRLLREIQRVESECALAHFLESEARVKTF